MSYFMSITFGPSICLEKVAFQVAFPAIRKSEGEERIVRVRVGRWGRRIGPENGRQTIKCPELCTSVYRWWWRWWYAIKENCRFSIRLWYIMVVLRLEHFFRHPFLPPPASPLLAPWRHGFTYFSWKIFIFDKKRIFSVRVQSRFAQIGPPSSSSSSLVSIGSSWFGWTLTWSRNFVCTIQSRDSTWPASGIPIMCRLIRSSVIRNYHSRYDWKPWSSFV